MEKAHAKDPGRLHRCGIQINSLGDVAPSADPVWRRSRHPYQGNTVLCISTMDHLTRRIVCLRFRSPCSLTSCRTLPTSSEPPQKYPRSVRTLTGWPTEAGLPVGSLLWPRQPAADASATRRQRLVYLPLAVHTSVYQGMAAPTLWEQDRGCASA